MKSSVVSYLYIPRWYQDFTRIWYGKRAVHSKCTLGLTVSKHGQLLKLRKYEANILRLLWQIWMKIRIQTSLEKCYQSTWAEGVQMSGCRRHKKKFGLTIALISSSSLLFWLQRNSWMKAVSLTSNSTVLLARHQSRLLAVQIWGTELQQRTYTRARLTIHPSEARWMKSTGKYPIQSRSREEPWCER